MTVTFEWLGSGAPHYEGSASASCSVSSISFFPWAVFSFVKGFALCYSAPSTWILFLTLQTELKTSLQRKPGQLWRVSSSDRLKWLSIPWIALRELLTHPHPNMPASWICLEDCRVRMKILWAGSRPQLNCTFTVLWVFSDFCSLLSYDSGSPDWKLWDSRLCASCSLLELSWC